MEFASKLLPTTTAAAIPQAVRSQASTAHSRNSSRQDRHLHSVFPQSNGALALSLDSIAENPQLALLLSPEEAAALSISCVAVMAVLHQRSVAPVSRPSAERLINAGEMAKLLGKSKSWVEKHPKDLPPRRSLVGNPCWLLSDVEKWLLNSPVYGRAAA